MSGARNVGTDFTRCLTAICIHSRATHCEYNNNIIAAADDTGGTIK